jgi:hypothetical protein
MRLRIDQFREVMIEAGVLRVLLVLALPPPRDCDT